MKAYLFVLPLVFFIGCGNGDDENRIEATGTIEATNVTLSSKTSGQILDINFIEGEKVSEGDTLLEIDHQNLQFQLNQAEAVINSAEAQLQLLKKGARKEDILQGEAQLKQTEVNFEQAEKDKERMQNLFNSKSITKKQLEDATTRYEVAKAQYQAAKENLEKLKNFARPEEIVQAEARLKQAQASADLLKKNISDSYIVSPMNGYVVKKYYEEGESVNPGSALLKLSDLDIVNLIIYVNELQLNKVKLGQTAEVYIDSKDEPFEGKVVYISPEAEFTPKNIQTKDERTKLVFAVKIEIPNPDHQLKAGLPADAVIILNKN